jgi:uncharacterized protein YggE
MVSSARLLALVTGCVTLSAVAPPHARAEPAQRVSSITVVGQGEVQAKADLAQVSVGVVTEAKTASEALAQNNAAMRRLLDALRARGVEPRDVQTTSFSVFPQYEHDGETRQIPRIVGYQVQDQVQVKVRQLDRLGQVLDDLVQGGANLIHGIGFSVAEPRRLLDQARKLAVEDARRKAELLALAAGSRLGPPLEIQEAGAGLPTPPPMARMAAAESAVPIATGELSLGAQVTVTYALGDLGTPIEPD